MDPIQDALTEIAKARTIQAKWFSGMGPCDKYMAQGTIAKATIESLDKALVFLASGPVPNPVPSKREELRDIRVFIQNASVALDYHEMMTYEERIKMAQAFLVKALSALDAEEGR